MPLGDFLRRNGFPIALAASVAAHGGAAFCAYCAGDREAQVAPFRRGRTTVSLRPTTVEPPSPTPTDQSEPPPPEIEPTDDERPTSPSFVSTPLRETKEQWSRPVEPAAERPELARTERAPEPVIESAAMPVPQTKVRRQVDIAQLDEVLQPLLSRANEGGKDDAEAAVHTQPSPPFPPHLPREPVRLRLDYTIDSQGRFRDVRIDSGKAESDTLIARFIESRWRATPATRFGRPVAKTYVGYLNFN